MRTTTAGSWFTLQSGGGVHDRLVPQRTSTRTTAGTCEDRVAGVAARFGLALQPAVVVALCQYVHHVLRWNTRLNLTGPADFETLIDRHLADSLCVLATCDLPHGAAVADVGSGAGFPGVPMAIVRRDLAMTLIEATRKKAAFLEHMCNILELGNVVVRCERAERLAHQPAFRSAFDIVVSRAAAPLLVAVELCLPLCRLGGVTVYVKGPAVDAELSAAGDHIERLGGRVESTRTCFAPGGTRRTVIVLVRKHAPTPDEFPLSARERRVVHLALRDDRRVTTSSVGENDDRRVVVHPSEWRRGARPPGAPEDIDEDDSGDV
ncbi:MAG: 16S rRNA (guanine(527)-N(7))-methyltransferase RsmG [Armatimonadota bacterium]|nr:16S rRNA (guanine(527)-N(7))-methyltransferase RsmG [Armatimonadota bacterium]